MDTAGRLRFIRALHSLSQAELSNLIGIDRSFYAGIETRRKRLPAPAAEVAADTFGISPGWLLGKEDKPLQRTNLLLVEFPAKRLSLLPFEMEKRRLKDACEALQELLLQFLADAQLSQIWIGRPSPRSAVVLCNVAGDQYLLITFDLDAAEELNELLVTTFESLCALPHTQIVVDKIEYTKIRLRSPHAVWLLLSRCGVPGDLRDKIRDQLSRSYADHYNFEAKLQGPTKVLLLDKIVADLASNDISLLEVKYALEKLGREDLL